MFVLAVAAVKAIWEDVKRHQEDKRMNTSITHRVNADGVCGLLRHLGAAAVGMCSRPIAAAVSVWLPQLNTTSRPRPPCLSTHPVCRLPRAGSISDISWTEVEVGNVIVVYDDELFPADLMCLYSELADNVCFIKTTNLDGETNLKIRKPLDLKGLQVGRGAGPWVPHAPQRCLAASAQIVWRMWLLRVLQWANVIPSYPTPFPPACPCPCCYCLVPAGE